MAEGPASTLVYDHPAIDEPGLSPSGQKSSVSASSHATTTPAGSSCRSTPSPFEQDETQTISALFNLLSAPFENRHKLPRDQLVADTRDLYASWHTLGREEKRSIIEAITEGIVVGNDRMLFR